MAKRKKKEQQLNSYQESGADYLKRTGLNANQESGADYLSRTKAGTPWQQKTTTTAQNGLYGSVMGRINARMQQDRERKAALANTKYWQQAAQDAAHSQNGDQSWQVYMAKQISDTPGGYDQWKAEQRRRSERETAKNRQLVQDMTYSGRHGAEDAYKLLQQGYNADQARQLIQRSDDIEDWYAKQTLRDRYKNLDADKKSGLYDWSDHPEVLDLTSWKTARGWINQQDYDISKTKQELATARQQEEGFKKFIEGRRNKSELAAAEERGGAPGNYAGELYDLLNNYDPEEPDEKHEQARNEALRNAENALREMNYGGVDFTQGDRNKVREYLYSMISGGKDTYADAAARLNAEGSEEAIAKRRAELQAESEGERNITLRAARDTLDGMMRGNAPRKAQIGRGARTDEDNEIARGYLYDSIMPDSYEERIAKYEEEGDQERIRKLNDALDNAMMAQMTGQDVDEYAGAIFDTVNGGDIEQKMGEEELPSAKKQQLDEILDRMIETGPQRNMFYTQEYLADADEYLEEPEVQAAQKLNRATQDRIKELEAEERMLAKYNGYITKYSLGNNGQYKPENDRGLDNPWQTQSDEDRGIQTTDVNRIYSYINGGKEWQAWATKYGTAEPQLTSEYDYAGMMNDTEIRIFNNFYNYGRYDEARQFLDGLKATGVLGARYREVESIRTQEAAKKMPITSSIGAQAMTTVNTALGPAQALAGLMGSESVKDPNSNWYAPARQSEEIQNTIAQELGPYGQTYLVGMNSIRNVINGFITRGMGVTGKAPQTVASLGVFASQIYQESTYKYLAETGDYNATRGLAALDAVMETAEELLPYEAMLSHYGGRPIIAYLANALSEAGEEFTGATVGDKIKGLITGRDSVEKRGDEIFAAGGYYDKNGQWVELDKSDTKKAVNEADAQALREKGEEIINNTLAGFAGGGLGAIYSGLTYTVDTYNQGRQVSSERNNYAGMTGAERLAQLGAGMKEGTQSHRIANEVLDTIQEGKKPNNYTLGKLYQAIATETGEEQAEVARETVERTVREQLAAAGVTGEEAEEYAGIIAKGALEGGRIDMHDRTVLARSAEAIKVWQEYQTVTPVTVEVVDKIDQATAKQKSVMDTLGELTQNTVKGSGVTADEVDRAIRRTKSDAEAIDYLQKTNPNLMSEEYAQTAKEILESDPEAKKTKRYVDDVMKIRMAALTYRENMPATNLTKESAQKLFAAAQKEAAEADRLRLENNKALQPGRGVATFEGAEYGTDEWTEKVKAQPKQVRNQMIMAAEVAKRFGHTVEFINDPAREMVNGWQIAQDGGIVINIASASGRRMHNMLATAVHEMTHWLEHNSENGYANLRRFILNSLEKNGEDIGEMVMRTIRNQDVVRAKEEASGKKSSIPQLTVSDAVAEIVAKGSEGILSSKEMKETLAKEDPGLYDKVKEFVKNFIARLDNALQGIDTSLSREARALKEERDQIAKLWLSAREEALGGKPAAEDVTPAQAMQMSVAQLDEAYMQAVEAGDTEQMQVMVEAAAEKAMPDSKMRLKNGKLRKLYHGTYSDTFTVFDPAWIGTAREGDVGFFGRGFYFAYTKGEASFYGNNVMEVYLNMVKPFNYQQQLQYLDGQRTYEYNASRAVFVTRFAELFPELANDHYVTVYEKGSDTAKELSLKEFAEIYKKTIKNQKFKVEKVKGEYGDEWLVLSDKKTESYTDDEGKEHSWTYYDFQQRSLNEADAKNQLTNAYLYLERSVYDHISIPNSTIIVMETNFSQALQERGYDGVIQSEDGDEAVVFDSKQIKLADTVTYDKNNKPIPLSERFNKTEPDIRYSVAEIDDQYMRAVEEGDTEKQQEMVNAAAAKNSYNIKAYHGTGRADRVGTVFRPDRATSGPMAFFTDNREIAENYARDKKDTSIAYDEEYGDYYNQFRVKVKGKSVPVGKLWSTLSFAERQKITEAAKHITLDDEAEEIIYDENAQYGIGNFTDYERKLHGWNSIDTLIDGWLEGGTLWNREGDFLKVLELAGIKGVTWNNPDARVEKVYDTFLKILKPFDTSKEYTKAFTSGLRSWWAKQNQAKYIRESEGADFWDKNSITMDEWIDDAERDIENGTTHNWTRIPDAVTAYLKEQEYDGIKDNGGKGGGAGHTVWIPFTSEQVKSADPVVRDDNGNVIPLSERFNPQKEDIRYSVEESPDMDVSRFMVGLNETSLKTVQERTMLRQFKGLQTNIDLYQMAAADNRRAIRKLEAKEKKDGKLSAYDRNELSKQRNLLKNNEERVDMLRRSLVKVTQDGGFAKLMFKQAKMMDRLVTGRTADEVRSTVRAMNDELENVTKEMAARSERLKKLAEKEAVLRIRQQFNRAGLRRIATKLKSEMNSDLDVETIENRLALIALKMKQEQFDKENTTELADLLVGKMHKAYDSYVLDELRGRTIVLGKAAMAELKGQNRTLADVRRELAGTGIRIASKGNGTLDQNWDELCDIIPGLDRNTNSGDQLDALLDVIRSEKRMTANEYGSDENMVQISAKILEAAQELMPEIVTSEKNMSAIREALKFVAEMTGEAKEAAGAMDEVNQMIRNLQKKQTAAAEGTEKLAGDIRDAIEYFNELGEQSEAAMWKSERVKLIEQLKSKNTQDLLAEQAKWREKIAKDTETRKQAESNMSLRKKINTNYSRMRKLIVNETDQKNVPEHMKSLARYMLQLLTENDVTGRKITGMDPKDLADTLRVLGVMSEQDGDFTIDDLQLITDEEAQAQVADALADLEEGIEEYNRSPGKGLLENLQSFGASLAKIQDAVAVISSVINAERSISFLDRRQDVADFAETVRHDMGRSRFRGEWRGRGSKAVNTAKNAVVYGNTTPVYFFKNLMNRGMQALWNDMAKSEDRNGLETQKAQDFMRGLGERTHYRDWAGQTHEVTLGGKKMTLTIGNMMELYAIWKREQTTNPEMSQHLSKGGVFIQKSANANEEGRLRREKEVNRATRVTDEEIAKIYDTLTKEQKEYLDSVVKYLSNDMSELGNEASMRMYGIKKYKESYYFPMKVWDGVKSARSDRGISGTDENRMAHRSWSKRRQHMAKNALVIGDFTEDAVRHIVEMINYNTMAPAIENLNKVLNYRFTEGEDADTETQRNLRVMFEEAYGKEALKYLETFMKDMNGGTVQDQRKTLRDRMLTIFKKNAVAGSLSVAMQQPLSYIRAAMMVSPKYLAGALNPQYYKGSYREMIEHSGVAVIKNMGRFDMNFGQSAKDYITPETKGNAYEKVSDLLTKLPQLMDTMTWTRMWSAVKMEQHALNPGMDMKSEAFLNKVAERFGELMRRTQVYDSVMVKSQNMRSQNIGMKIITSFMAEPTLSLNVLADAVRNAGQEGGKANLAKAGATFMLSAVMQALVKALMGSGRTPDKKKTWEENFWNKFGYNLINEVDPAGLIPGFNDMIEVLKNGELTDDAMSIIGKLTSVWQTASRAVNGNGRGAWRDIEDTAGQLAQMFTNIPAKNIARDARAMLNFFGAVTGISAEGITGDTYANRATSRAVIRKQLLENIHTADNLIGVVNQWLGDAGYKTDNKAYYERLYKAERAGDTQAAEEIREYLQAGKGIKSEQTIEQQMRGMIKNDAGLTDSEKIKALRDKGMKDSDIAQWIADRYRDGEITKDKAVKLYLEANPKKTKDEAYFYFEQAEWEARTGKDVGTSDYFRLNDAVDSGNAAEYKRAAAELENHGHSAEEVEKHTKSRITANYKDGKITKQAAQRQLKELAKLDENESWWTLDRIDYQKETKKEDSVSGYYYRLTDAVNANRQEQITSAVQQLLKHGITKDKIKSKLSDWKSEYLKADSAGRIRIRDAITKAYRAAGYTKADADKTIEGWKKDEKKKTNKK